MYPQFTNYPKIGDRFNDSKSSKRLLYQKKAKIDGRFYKRIRNCKKIAFKLYY